MNEAPLHYVMPLKIQNKRCCTQTCLKPIQNNNIIMEIYFTDSSELKWPCCMQSSIHTYDLMAMAPSSVFYKELFCWYMSHGMGF